MFVFENKYEVTFYRIANGWVMKDNRNDCGSVFFRDLHEMMHELELSMKYFDETTNIYDD